MPSTVPARSVDRFLLTCTTNKGGGHSVIAPVWHQLCLPGAWAALLTSTTNKRRGPLKFCSSVAPAVPARSTGC
eukprot:1151448-Pelagomonas_calceolata.AAC.1